MSPACHSPFCAKCRINRWKEKHPLKWAFRNLRDHAKERGKDFSLTFEQFRSFCLNTDYMKLKGKTSMSLQIDRKDNSEGYHAWNIQAISLRENTRKNYVPYFQKYIEETMAETQAAIAEAYPEKPIPEYEA